MMRIEYGDSESFEVAPGGDVSASIAAVESSQGFADIIRELAGDTHFAEFDYDQGGISDAYAEKVMDAFLSADLGEGSHLNAAEDWISEFSRKHGDGAYETYNAMMAGTSLHNEVRDGLVVALARQHPDAHTDDIVDDVEELLRDSCINAIRDSDESGPLDSIPPHAKVEVCYIPDYPEAGDFHDMWIHPYRGVNLSAADVLPNDNFVRFLRFANVSSNDYINHMRVECGVDLTADPNPSRFERGEDDWRFEEAKKTVALWRALSVEADPSKPALMNMESIVEVLDNATHGGVPILFCRVYLRAFIERDWSKPMMVTGGQVGIQDFLNGSGHLTNADGPLVAPADPSRWVVPKNKGCDIGDIYGFVPEALRIEIEDLEPTPEVASAPSI